MWAKLKAVRADVVHQGEKQRPTPKILPGTKSYLNSNANAKKR